MEKILAVLTKEKQYAERLCSYCNRKSSLLFTAVPFDNAAECSAFSQKHPIGILLADSMFLNDGYGHSLTERAEIRAAKILRFSEEYSFANALAEPSALFAETDTIPKYQSAETILRNVLRQCEDVELLHSSEAAGRPVRIIGIYSPLSRCGKSAFALTLCKALSRKRKTLYLSFEEFSGFSLMTGEEYASCLSDALYHMKQGTLNAQKIYAMIYQFSGIDFIPPVRYAEDRSAVSGDDYVRLLHLILKQTQYEILVADMNRFAEEASDIMEICDVVYMPVLDSYPDNIKTESFLEYLRTSGRTRLTDKIVEIHPPVQPIPQRGASYVDALLYGSMGDLVRSLNEA